MGTIEGSDLGLWVRELRESRGLTQLELGEAMTRAGFSWHQTTVGKVENGSRRLAKGELDALIAVANNHPRVLEDEGSERFDAGLENVNSLRITIEQAFVAFQVAVARAERSKQARVMAEAAAAALVAPFREQEAVDAEAYGAAGTFHGTLLRAMAALQGSVT
jgi:transcriptional regulator with XRE-family HTH domain